MSDPYVPTLKLRFVERQYFRGTTLEKTVRVLQQWWETEIYVSDGTHRLTLPQTVGEWRDVPLETE